MSWIFNFVKDTLSGSSDFIRSVIGYNTEQRILNPETLRNKIQRREEEEAKRREEAEMTQREERRQRAKTLADAADKRIARKKANDTLLETLKNDKRFRRQQQREVDENGQQRGVDENVQRRELFANASERRRLRIEPSRRRRLLSNVVQHLEIRNPFPNASPTFFLLRSKHLITKFLRENPKNKIRISLVVKLAKNTTGEESKATFWSSQEIILKSTDANNTFNRMKSKIIEGLVKYSKNGSGWFVTSVEKIQIDKSSYDPVKGSSHIPLPEKIEDKKALINIQNKDDMCFKYAVTRALNPVRKCRTHFKGTEKASLRTQLERH